jgi:hypothetical protein
MNHKCQLAFCVAILFETILFVTVIISVVSRQWRNFFLALLTIVCLILPFILTRLAKKKSVILPDSFEVVALLFIFSAQYLGEIKKFYSLWWWDLLLHGIFGSYAVIVALYLRKGIIQKDQSTTDSRFTFFNALFAFSFSITLGTLWEMFEFSGDYLFKTTMVKDGLVDTATDLLIKILAAFLTTVLFCKTQFKKNRLSQS